METHAAGRHEPYLRHAIDLARQSALEERAGGPFAALVVRDGEIVGEGTNQVLAERDPTWHGEVAAIRAACRRLDTHDLTGCDLYTTGEPCPMCYGAAWWARIRTIYYASTMDDALTYGGFDDRLIYQQLALPPTRRKVPLLHLPSPEMQALWQTYYDLPGRVKY